MRFISYTKDNKPGFGVVTADNKVIELAGKVAGADCLATLVGSEELLGRAKDYAATATPSCDYDAITLEPVIPQPSKIICVGINYVAHAAEAGRKVGQYPVIFQRFADTLQAADAPIIRPVVSPEFDFEAELAVVIGKGGGHIAPEDAMKHVAGYTCFNDSSVRDWQFHTHQYGMGKTFRKTGALGPWLVTTDEIADYRELEIKGVLNGEQMQEGKLSELAFDIPHLISYVSQALDWNPGDILATGTPSGIGFKRNPPIFLKPGDVFEVVISQIGTLTNTVADEA
ncbi:fumarylacetoacetate hydrolase family protein [Marinobacterium lutimaris]|uniref:2-keto-4-pentenoate hydratase/2-oxohepta-3-ene-1,7-dioic acid hydratase (Catechol pathway) n=1 Tax=Marinobacterium lutimaris TaxID=568106 RepID=A0A1H6DTZ0_9GAMM|nr:fumarylacetoacetate hydrolase family protein [Marinobacterium lutimaris]SEG88203.1 2-keto-4-pentenoate hydratase/2-oxohepta-3-ene-1,7-dioic acid hydratase (catechol pathway) [Marinobacterium lutimaris]